MLYILAITFSNFWHIFPRLLDISFVVYSFFFLKQFISCKRLFVGIVIQLCKIIIIYEIFSSFLSWLAFATFLYLDYFAACYLPTSYSTALLTLNWIFMQASLLSLNLLALADNFAKIDLSKRLFIESDLLSTELVCLLSKSFLKITWLVAFW